MPIFCYKPGYILILFSPSDQQLRYMTAANYKGNRSLFFVKIILSLETQNDKACNK